MGPGSAQNPHVLRVRSGFCALAGPKLADAPRDKCGPSAR
ncbi:DNA metabolism protein [Salmonella enterica]|nr:DNA metabolism protein [Salmonella enterica]